MFSHFNNNNAIVSSGRSKKLANHLYILGVRRQETEENLFLWTQVSVFLNSRRGTTSVVNG